ncbi:MAG: hypothetical protein RR585_02680 [Coprobacillus sp.]
MKKIKIVLTAILCTFLLAGCNQAKDVEKTAKEDLTKIEETVKADVEKTEEFSKEKIEEAVNYIHKNVEKMKDANVTKKVYEYCVYLEAAAKKAGVTVEHDVLKLATTTKEHAVKIYTAAEGEVEALVKGCVDGLKTQIDYFKTDSKNLADEFHKLLKGE